MVGMASYLWPRTKFLQQLFVAILHKTTDAIAL